MSDGTTSTSREKPAKGCISQEFGESSALLPFDSQEHSAEDLHAIAESRVTENGDGVKEQGSLELPPIKGVNMESATGASGPQMTGLRNQQWYKRIKHQRAVSRAPTDPRARQFLPRRASHIARALKAEPVCSAYLSWVAKKKQLRERLFKKMELRDLVVMERTADPGTADTSLMWDHVAQRPDAETTAGPVAEPEHLLRMKNRFRSVLEKKTRWYIQAEGLSNPPPGLDDPVDLDDPEYVNFWMSHLDDMALNTVYNLYIGARRRHISRWRPDEVPAFCQDVLQAQGVPATADCLETLLHDATEGANPESFREKMTWGTASVAGKGESSGRQSLAEACLPGLSSAGGPSTAATERRKTTQVKDIVLVDIAPAQQRAGAKKNIKSCGEFLTKSMKGSKLPPLVKSITKLQGSKGAGAAQAKGIQPGHVSGKERRHEESYRYTMLQEARKRRHKKAVASWQQAFRLVKLICTVSRIIGERSYDIDQKSQCFVDISENSQTTITYGEGRSIKPELYKRQKEISLSCDLRTTLAQPPEERTLVQLDQAVRELVQVQLFAEYPCDVQERFVRRAFYLSIGPKRVIVRQGHKVQFFYIILSGNALVKNRVLDPKTGKETLQTFSRFISEGMTSWELAPNGGRDRTATVVSRVRMQLLGAHMEDFHKIFVTLHVDDYVQPYISFLSELDIMIGWPVEQLLVYPRLCGLFYFSRNKVITHDSQHSKNIYIVRTGYCKVFRMLSWKDSTDRAQRRTDLLLELADLRDCAEDTKAVQQREQCVSNVMSRVGRKVEDTDLDRGSEYVSFRKVKCPRGNIVKWPVIRCCGVNDPLEARTLRLPVKRKFVLVRVLREADVFGLDQLPFFKRCKESRAVILVSMGAECIALSKALYCQFATKQTVDIVNHKAFVYSDNHIRTCLNDKVNQDVYLEHVLDKDFVKFFRGM